MQDKLEGAYGIPYDPSEAIQNLTLPGNKAILELWENLYHQGTVGLASYAAIPELVVAGELNLVAAIEVARYSDSNPKLPEFLKPEYTEALDKALNYKPKNEEQYKGYYTIHASLNGQHKLAKALDLLDVEELLNEYG